MSRTRYRAVVVSLLAAAATFATGAATATAAPVRTDVQASASTCSVEFPDWVIGYTAVVTVTGPTSGWSVPYVVPSGQQNTVVWGARNSLSGQNGTASNTVWNGNLGSGQSTVFGLVFTKAVGDNRVTSFPTCTVAG